MSYQDYLPESERAALRPAPATGNKKKGFPVFGIPAIIMLSLMLLVFVLEVLMAFGKANLFPTAEGAGLGNVLRALSYSQTEGAGLGNFVRVLSNSSFFSALANTVLFRTVQLLVSGMLSAGLCALYFAMRKPGTVRTLASLWLIPACLPQMTMTMLFQVPVYRAGGSDLVMYLITCVLQTTSLFCFFGGVFTYKNMHNKGRTGMGPFFGLLVAVLVWLLGALSVDTVYTILGRERLMDRLLLQSSVSTGNFSMGAALGVIKVVLQIVIAFAPLLALCLMARKKSTRGKTPLSVLWIALALPVGILMVFLLSLLGTGSDIYVKASLNSLTAAILGGSFGGLLAYSFLHLMRRVNAFLYGVIAAVLAAAMSCIAAQYSVFANLRLINTMWPGMILSAFDWRLILLISALAYALRDYRERYPGSLALSIALMTAALTWGNTAVAGIYNYNQSAITVSMLAVRETQQRMETTVTSTLLLTLPPLFLGLGAALLMKRGLRAPEGGEFRG